MRTDPFQHMITGEQDLQLPLVETDEPGSMPWGPEHLEAKGRPIQHFPSFQERIRMIRWDAKEHTTHPTHDDFPFFLRHAIGVEPVLHFREHALPFLWFCLLRCGIQSMKQQARARFLHETLGQSDMIRVVLCHQDLANIAHLHAELLKLISFLSVLRPHVYSRSLSNDS